MRNREVPPLKPTSIDLDSHRFTNNKHYYDSSINCKSLSLPFSILLNMHDSFILLFFYSPHCTSGHQYHRLSRRLNLPTKYQTSIGSIEKVVVFPFAYSSFLFFSSFLLLNSPSSRTTNGVYCNIFIIKKKKNDFLEHLDR